MKTTDDSTFLSAEDARIEHSGNIEKTAPHASGMLFLLLGLLFIVAATLALTYGIILCAQEDAPHLTLGVVLIVVSGIWIIFPGWLFFAGLKIVKPNEAYVLTLFGKYFGSLKKDGFFFVNPFAVATNPLKSSMLEVAGAVVTSSDGDGKKGKSATSTSLSNKISLKAMTLSNNKQKINDLMGNPIEIGIVVIWRVVDTARAVFNVDNFLEFLSMQCDSALRNIVRLYPYDTHDNGSDEMSLRGSSQEIAERLKEAIQEKVDIAGLEIIEARITHLAYAPEIAAAMLQRQQASAIVDARTLIVKGAVGMVQQALSELAENGIVDLDEERKANMVSNLLVVLCGNKDAQPIVNSGSLY
ncbi:MAG: SPFH domain-containing protein [Coriobacteriaceae bacterium]|nr:SPFH domain-containing protein [Coriobacteriaceae bacterium]